MADLNPKRTNLRLARAVTPELRPEAWFEAWEAWYEAWEPWFEAWEVWFKAWEAWFKAWEAWYGPVRLDFWPERLNLRPERPDLRLEKPDLKPEAWFRAWGGNEQTNGGMKVPLCSTGLRPLLLPKRQICGRGRCPKKTKLCRLQ